MTNTERIQANNEDLRDCIETAENLPDANGVAEITLQEKSATPSKSAQDIVADDGFDGLSKVSVGAIPSEYIIPSGMELISSNGPYDVTAKASVIVEVPIPDDYIIPSGTENITENGAYDITKYASVIVNVASSGGGELPTGFKRCDYIQFNGTQWIDTGIIGTHNTQINTCFTWENSTQRHLFGCASSDNTKSITSYMNGSWRFGNKSTSKSVGTKNAMLPYSALVNKTTISITNSVSSISDVNEFETVGTLLLGGCRDADGTPPGVGITGKVFFFYLWQGDEQVLKLIPVVDEAGNYYFWDCIGKNLHASITSTPLSGGNT